MMECPVFKAKILTKSSIKIANASLFEILSILLELIIILIDLKRLIAGR